MGRSREKEVQSSPRQGSVYNEALSRPVGHPHYGGSFTLANDRNSPVFMFRDYDFSVFTHVSNLVGGVNFTAGADALTFDPIARTIVKEWGPLFRTYMSRMQPYDTLPSCVDIVKIYQKVELLYQTVCHVMAKRYMAQQFDWSQVPLNEKGSVPPSVRIDAELWRVHNDVYFETYWSPLIQRIARLPHLPRLREMTRLMYQPFVIGERDAVIRQFTFGEWAITSAGDLTTLLTTLEGYLTTLETDIYIGKAIQWLLQYIPHRCGVPEMGFIGVSPFHAMVWWNASSDIGEPMDGATDANNLVPTTDLAVASEGLQFSHTNFGGTSTHLPNATQYNASDVFHVGAYAGQISMNELMCIPIWKFVKYVAGAPNKTMVVPATFARSGAPMVLDDDSEDLVEISGIPVNTVDAAFDEEVIQYLEMAECRHILLIPATTFDAAFNGMHSEVLQPVQLSSVVMDQLTPLAVMQILGFDELTELDSVSAGARPSEARQNIADIYKRHA